jgi:hypothetical protein
MANLLSGPYSDSLTKEERKATQKEMNLQARSYTLCKQRVKQELSSADKDFEEQGNKRTN